MQSKNIGLVAAMAVLVLVAGLYLANNKPVEQVAVVPVTSQQTVQQQALPATVGIVSVNASASANSAAAGSAASSERVIKWASSNFPAGAKVNISLLRMVNDSPVEYEFVRSIATNAPNSGEITWTPAENELGEDGADLYISVECANAIEFKGGCSVTSSPVKAL